MRPVVQARPTGADVAVQSRGAGKPASRRPVLVVHPGAELYGADRVLRESVAALATQFDVTVALPSLGPLVEELETLGARVVRCRMPVLRNSAMRPRGAVRLVVDAFLGVVPALRLLRRHGAGGVYVNTLTLPSWTLLARLARVPSLCHVHEAEQSAPRVLRLAMAVCPLLARRIVTNSQFCLDVLTEVVPRLRDKCTVVLNCVHGPAELIAPRATVDGPVRLLYVGRLSPRKGPQIAVATLAELLARGIDARLQLVGSVFEGYEWFEAELRRSVETADLAERVEFVGFRADVWPHLAAADVVLVPSIAEESFGNVAVEAVLAARPLVVSDTSGLREAAGGYRSVQAVAPGVPEVWADAVERVVTQWPTFRRAAMDDAGLARQRHSFRRYQASLVAAMTALAALR